MWSKYTSFLISKFSDGIKEGDFSYDNIIKTLEHAYKSVKYNIPKSSLIWNQYRDFVSMGLEDSQARDSTIAKLRDMYLERVSIPHKTLSDTYNDFSSFTTNTNNENYDKEMSSAYKIYSNTLKLLEKRDTWEKLIKDDTSPVNYAAYIQWEITLEPKKFQIAGLTMALYERALNEYPEIPEIWDDYILYVTEKAFSVYDILAIVERGLLACPFSGLLWAHRLRLSMIQNANLDELRDIKQAFTSIPAVKSVERYHDWKTFIVEWITYLARQERQTPDSAIEELLLDGEEALDRAKEQGKVDPNFEVELTVYRAFKPINYDFSWRDMVKNHGDKAEYWITRIDAELDSGADHETIRKSFDAALKRKSLDWPEKVYDKRVEFERNYGTPLTIQKSLAASRVGSKISEHKRNSVYQQQSTVETNPQAVLHPVEIIESGAVKRTFDDIEMDTNDDNPTSEFTPASSSLPNLEVPSAKVFKDTHTTDNNSRDRENNTVIVSGYPASVVEADLRRFFKDCGEILGLNIGDEQTATVEFSDHFGALSALTRDNKKLKGSEVSVKSGEETTLWVTNFPPEYTEENIRELLGQYGTIMSIRFPSLKFNTHRRFCYVQFSAAQDARKAIKALDGEHFGNFTIQLKISDPSKKNERSGAIYEDREVFIKGLDFNKVDENELKQILGEYGTIERIRLPLSRGNEKLGRLHDGYGFVVFSTAAEAEAAIKVVDGMKLGSRNLHISLASHKKAGPKKISKVVMDQPHDIDVDAKNLTADINARTLSISNLADTVNDAQLTTIFEKFGPLKQIILRPDLNGARVEYANVADAGKAELSLQGHVIGGKPISIGAQAPKPKSSNVQTSNKPQLIPRALLRKKRV